MDAQTGAPPAAGGGTPSLSHRVRVWPSSQDRDTVLVPCCRTGYGTTHSGVVFRSHANRWMMFHQAWHETTSYEPLDEALVDMEVRGLLFAVVGYPPPVARNLLRFCRSIASHPQAVPFAFGFDEDAGWDEATGRLRMPHGKGLTCVNFVALLFKSAGVIVLDRTGWPTRPGDEDFQRQVLQSLEAWCKRRSPDRQLTTADRRHLAEVQKEIDSGCVRIRSEELAGAVLSTVPRPTHVTAIPAGVFVSRAMDAFAAAAGR